MTNVQSLSNTSDPATDSRPPAREFNQPGTPAPTAVEPKTLGAALRQTRLARRIEIRDAARSLNLPVGILEDLEADRFDQLGAPIYTRSFLVRYADLLEVPRDRVIARYKELDLQEPKLSVTTSVSSSRKRPADKRWFVVPLVLIGIGWLGWLGYQQLGGFFTNVATSMSETTEDSAATNRASQSRDGARISLPGQTQKRTATTDESTPASEPNASLVALPNAPERLADDTDSTFAVTNSPSATQQTDVTTPTVMPALTETGENDGTTSVDTRTETLVNAPSSYLNALIANPSAAEATANELAPNADDQTRVQLTLSADCWVQIIDGEGNRLVYGLLKADSRHEIAGAAPFEVTLGNSTAVQLSLNDQPVATDLYWRDGGVSRFTLPISAQSG